MRPRNASFVAAALLMAACSTDDQLETYGGGDRPAATVTELPGGGRIAVGTPDGYRLSVQVEDAEGEVGDAMTIYTSDTGRRDQGRYKIVRPQVYAAANTVVIQAQLVPDDLPEGEDFEDLHVGLLAATEDVDDLDDWAVVDEAEPFAEVRLSRDGSEVVQPIDNTRLQWVWRGGTFVREPR